VFGEGVALVGRYLVELTWKSGEMFVLDPASLRLVARLRVPAESEGGPKEGWGVTADPASGDRHMILSDGTTRLHRAEIPADIESIGAAQQQEQQNAAPVESLPTLLMRGTIDVHDDSAGTSPVAPLASGSPGFESESAAHEHPHAVEGLNELEWVDGELLANIYGSDCIARIRPADGAVLGWILADRVWPDRPFPAVNVLNGIAFDASARRLLLTGKLWPTLHEVKLHPVRITSDALHRRCRAHPTTFADLSHSQNVIEQARNEGAARSSS
jgi:glutamine cyclotransferase